MSRVDLSGALMHISDAKTFSPSEKKKKKGKEGKNTAPGYIKEENGERGELERVYCYDCSPFYPGCRINFSI